MWGACTYPFRVFTCLGKVCVCCLQSYKISLGEIAYIIFAIIWSQQEDLHIFCIQHYFAMIDVCFHMFASVSYFPFSFSSYFKSDASLQHIFIFLKPSISSYVCSHIVHFILHFFLYLRSASKLLRLGEVHTSNVYVVVVGVMRSCCICLCVLKYQRNCIFCFHLQMFCL